MKTSKATRAARAKLTPSRPTRSDDATTEVEDGDFQPIAAKVRAPVPPPTRAAEVEREASEPPLAPPSGDGRGDTEASDGDALDARGPSSPARGPAPEEQRDAAADPEAPDPVPPPVRALLELFQGTLREVRFPDVDREVLEAACSALRAADSEVNQLFGALEAAQARLSERRAELARLAERSLAYAKVFAAEDRALLDRVETIDLAGPKRPGRKPAERAQRSPRRVKGANGAAPAGPGLVEHEPEGD